MNYLLKSAKIYSENSAFHKQTKDIYIEDGIIKSICEQAKCMPNTKIIQHDNLCVSEGWFDSSVCFGVPGNEIRESIENGLNTAGLSGFTTILYNNNIEPKPTTASVISALKNISEGYPTDLFPVGCLITKDNNLADLYDMSSQGVSAFGNYQMPIEDMGMLKMGLLYTQNFDGIIISFPYQKKIAPLGIMHEGETSLNLGFQGIPNIVETIKILSDTETLKYYGGKLHIPTISTAESVSLIRQSKDKGLDVSCSVAIPNLCFTDKSLLDYNQNFKLLPPLRSKTDREALLKGVLDQTIDMVTSNHNPINKEIKDIEIQDSAFGTIGLETAFGTINNIFGTEHAIKILTQGRQRFGLKSIPIEIEQKANLTLFDASIEYTFESKDILSTSKNCAYLGKKLKGKALGVINHKKAIYNIS